MQASYLQKTKKGIDYFVRFLACNFGKYMLSGEWRNFMRYEYIPQQISHHTPFNRGFQVEREGSACYGKLQ